MGPNLIMLGPPGAGKGTQAERFARSRRIPKISTGDILREAVQAGTEVGARAKVTMDRGELVSDDIMIGIVGTRLNQSDALGGFILDGFPRTVPQARALDGMVEGRGPLVVVDIVVPESELVRRLGSRMICADCGANAGTFVEGEAAAAARGGELTRCLRCGGPLVQRADDNAAVVLQRFKIYQRDTKPLVEYYRGRPTFSAIDGAQPSDKVAADIAAAIESASGLAGGVRS